MSGLATEDRGRVRVLRLARPERRNALDRAAIEALVAALEDAAAAEDVAAIVLAAEGPVFCAGADLAEMRALREDPAAMAARRAMTRAMLSVPARLGKPVVAAVQGPALGAGAALALACDMAVMAEGARLGFPEARHGMVPEAMVPALLRHLPPRRVFDLLATGRDVPAGEALSLGLVEAVVPAAALMEAACARAEAAALLPPADLTRLKELVYGKGEAGA